MRYAFLIALFVLALQCFAIFQPGLAITNDEKENVVEIYNQNKKLIGTGTSISFSGLILTAKHVLEDTSEAGARSPNYLLKVLVRRLDATKYEPGELLIVHPFMDLAVLIKSIGEAIPPLPIGRLKDLGADSTITLIGHRQSTRGDELYKERAAKIDEFDRHGHIIVGRGVEKGTSGGPAIHNGRLIGVIRSSDHERTTVVPIDGALEYFQLMGLRFSDDGLAFESDDIAKLASKASQYEKILMDIQTDVNWFAEMKPEWYGNDREGFPDDIKIHIWYNKKLSTQPTFDFLIAIRAIPIFAGAVFESLASEQLKKFPREKWYHAKRGRVQFGDFGMDIEALLNREYRDLGICRDDFRGFDIIAQIKSIVGEGFIKVPGKQTVCFSLRCGTDDEDFRRGVKDVGYRCAAEKFKQ